MHTTGAQQPFVTRRKDLRGQLQRAKLSQHSITLCELKAAGWMASAGDLAEAQHPQQRLAELTVM